MLRKLVLAGIAVAASGAISGASAQEGNLVKITSQSIDLSKGKTQIDLSKTRAAYNGIRVRAMSGDADLTCVQVVYSNGRVHNEDRLIHLLEGERSRPIDAGSPRHIDQVNIVNKIGKGKATIEVLGYETDRGAGMAREPSKLPTGGGGCFGDAQISNAAKAAVAANEKPTQKIETTPTAPTKSDPATAGRARDGGDVLFGAQNVGFGVDRDVIRVGAEVGKFDRIRLRVLDNDIHINEVKVIYTNGEPDLLAVNANVPQNSKTNWLDLKGDRFIKEIQLNYRSKPSTKGQARVEVFGQFADGWLGPNGEGRKYNQGWVLLGAQTAGFVGFDSDTIPVGRNEGGFKKIRLTVKDRAITLNELRVVYASGSEDIIPVKARVDAGTTYGPIEIKGGSRAIKEIQAKYRSRFFDKSARGKGAAIVEVWGQH